MLILVFYIILSIGDLSNFVSDIVSYSGIPPGPRVSSTSETDIISPPHMTLAVAEVLSPNKLLS